MTEYIGILHSIIDNFKKLVYPEEWIDLDLSFSKSELFTMMLVDRHGEITMSQIADYINVPMSTATGVVERLVKNGYLERDRSYSDRRVVVIELTDNGKKVIEGLKSTMLSYIQLIYDALTDEERLLLGKVFVKITNIINEKNSGQNKDNQEAQRLKKINIE